MTGCAGLRAFRTAAFGIEGIVLAKTPGRARTVTVHSARDADYRIRYPDVVVRRDPRFDDCRFMDGTPPRKDCCYAPELLRCGSSHS